MKVRLVIDVTVPDNELRGEAVREAMRRILQRNIDRAADDANPPIEFVNADFVDDIEFVGEEVRR